jgi:hypothetical protein
MAQAARHRLHQEPPHDGKTSGFNKFVHAGSDREHA